MKFLKVYIACFYNSPNIIVFTYKIYYRNLFVNVRMEKEKENDQEDQFVIKYYEPYDDVIYFMKTVTVKEVRI